jgi:general secretion pathway protein E
MQYPQSEDQRRPADAKRPDMGEAFGHHLHARGTITESALQRAIYAARDAGQRLETVFPTLGLISERDFAEALAEFLKLPLVNAAEFPRTPLLEERLGIGFLRDRRVLPLRMTDGALVIAMANPLDSYALDAVRFATGERVNPCVAYPADIEAAFARLYSDDSAQVDRHLTGEIGALQNAAYESDLQRLKDSASDAPVIRLVSALVSRAVQMGASDIHLEPGDAELRVRYRVDGVLQELESVPGQLASAVLSRIKVMAKLNLAEHRLPQDGRIATAVRGRDIDIRVAISPVLRGERATLRLLDRNRLALDLADLGFDDGLREQLREIFSRPNGIFLVTGPTGSGKTTTLYAALSELNRPDSNILTIEDPIEYQLPGINQAQVKPQIGLTFAAALRSFLRQDPDIMMVGEIRDLETAQVAVQAALTGHLILSTVHTNDAASTVTRLVDMGVEDYLITATLSGVVAQRLVRKLCLNCRESYEPVPAFALGLQQDLTTDPITQLYRAPGCDTCSQTGYQGRTVIAEVLSLSDEICDAILRRADGPRIQTLARQAGMQSIWAHGVRRAIAGETSIEEVFRVAGSRP